MYSSRSASEDDIYRGYTVKNIYRGLARKRVAYAFAIFLLTTTPVLLGQGLGAISGTVTDTSGALIHSATVTATQADTGITTEVKTNDRGLYVFPSLPPARYSISITATGFRKFVEKDVVLQADQSELINTVRQLGETSQTVSVTAEGVQVDTTTGTLSQVIDQRRVNDLPLNGRNAAQLVTLVAGVVLAPVDNSDQGPTKTFPVAVTAAINGSRSADTAYMMDGGNNIDEYTNVNQPFPFPDALQEFSVQTSNYNAEYGQNAGGVVNIITKSGSNALHGNLFEYVRNRVFNARNYFSPTVDPLKRNQFGGTVGGPVVIPHLLSGKHTFFFAGYQKTIIRDQQGGKSSFVPTQANLSGDFSAELSASNPANPLGKVVQIINPFTGVAYPNNKIDPRTFDPAAVALAKLLPSVGGNGLVFYQNPIAQGYNEVVARVDHDPSSKDHLFAHYYQNHFTNAGVLNTANLLTYADFADIRVQSALVSETHTFTSNVLNNLVVNYSREVSTRGPLPNAPSVADFGVNIYQPPNKAIVGIAATGFFSLGDNAHAAFQRNNYTLVDDLHWVKGNHNLAFGVHAELSKVDINSEFNQPGSFAFNSNNTNYALASYLLGYLFTFQQGAGQYFNDRGQFYGFYAQDSWKATRRLTLTYGLRYEPFVPWKELENRVELFSPEAYAAGRTSTVYTNAPAGLLFPGDQGVPERGVSSVYSNVMPRVGFAYDVFGDGKTSVRGGGGLFYDTRQPAISNSIPSEISPFSLSVSLTNPKGTFSNPYAGINNPFPAPVPPPKNVIFPTPVQVNTYSTTGHAQVPLTYNWNLTVEQQLTKSLISRIGYVAAHSSHLFLSEQLNPATYIPGSTLGPDQRRHYPGFTNIGEWDSSGNESYQSLQLTLQQRVTKGLSVMANYTFSKALDTLPYLTVDTTPSSGPGAPYVIPIYQPNYKSLDHGPTDFDRRSVFSGSYLWAFPTLEGSSRLLRALVNGWQTTGIFQAETGAPITITAGKDVSMTGLNQDRAQYSGQKAYGPGACVTSASCKNYLNPAAFALPTTGNFGNVIKGSFRGPGYFDWDAGLMRNFPLVGEAIRLEFRAEYFNLMNHTNFGAPVGAVSSAGFGSITNSSDPRIGQLSAKFVF
jgi:Carboxypeptidase regulatory-like domain